MRIDLGLERRLHPEARVDYVIYALNFMAKFAFSSPRCALYHMPFVAGRFKIGSSGGSMKPFYTQPILNSPYHEPTRHHALGDDGQPLDQPPIIGRRRSHYIVPVPAARKKTRAAQAAQAELLLDAEGSGETRYNPSVIVNEIRSHVSAWRKLPHSADWGGNVQTGL